MENKKWTDADLRTAFEDGCKFLHFKDLQDFLLERRQNVDTSKRQLTIPDVNYCNCSFAMVMRDVNTGEPYCAECGKLIKQLL